MSHVFISYAREDVEFAQKLDADLQRRGIATWMDGLGIRGGADWPDRIAGAIADCAAMLVILSPESMASKWVERELAFADNKGKRLLPLSYRPAELPGKYELRFGDVQRVDFTGGGYEANLAKLVASMEQELGLQIVESTEQMDVPGQVATSTGPEPEAYLRQQPVTSVPSIEPALPRVNSPGHLERVQGDGVIWEKDGKEMVRSQPGGSFMEIEKRQRICPNFGSTRHR